MDELVDRLRPRNLNPARYAASVNAGTIDDQIGRFRELSEAGVAEVMISLPDLDTLDDGRRRDLSLPGLAST